MFTSKHLRALLIGGALCAGFIAVILAPRTISAQTSLGTLTGTVRDAAGAVIVGANVTATDSETGEIRANITNSLGAYRLDALPAGNYTLHVEGQGFERYEVKNIAVSPSQLVSYDVTLKLGAVSETVSVTSEEVLLNKENGSLSGTIDEESLAKLPIFSLNPIEILTTVPGVQIVSNSGFSNGIDIQVSGARPRANNFMIDGEEINDAGIGGQAVQPQIPDMYADAVIYTHNPPAEFGRASGGVVNLITKGGSNTFHGTAWELYSGSGLNATDGQTRQIVPKAHGNKARFDEHQYGFTAGGPIVKNKLFAFGALQLSRIYGLEQPAQLQLPDAATVAMLKTMAGGTGTTATNAALMLQYLSNATYVNNFLDFGAVTSVSLGAACPASNPNCTFGIDLWRRPNVAEKSPDTQWTYRIDFTPNKSDTLTARYLHDRGSLTPDFFANPSSLPGFDTYQGGPSELGQGTWTHVFSPTFLNEFRAAETRITFLFAPTGETLKNSLYKAPTLNFNNMSSLGFNQNFPQGRGQEMYQFQDTISWTHGRQTLRAGVDIGRRIEKDLVSQNANGSLSFVKGGSGSSAEGNFLLDQLGPSGTASKTFGSTRLDPHSWRSGAFAQDDVKVSSDLTVNIGIRYDYYTSPENSLKYPALDPSNPYAPIDTVIKVTPDKKDFAPRLGFAYTPHTGGRFADGRTVIRGGFGMFYDSDFTNIAINEAQSAPNSFSTTLIKTTGNGLSGATGLIPTIPAKLSSRSSVLSVVKGLVSPYSEEWNFGVERELPGQIAVSATYVGSHGVKLFANQQYNYFSFDTGLRLDPSRGAINARGNFAGSSYQGLEVGVKHNFSHGLAILGSYNYSKNLDDGSEVFTAASDSTSYSADLSPGGRGLDWGNSAYDHRHYAAITYVWTPKGLHSDNRGADTFLSAMTRHWTISGSSRFQSGAYSTVNFLGLDSNGDGSVANDRPILSNKTSPMDSVGIDGIYLGAPTTGTYYDLAALDSTGAVNQVDPKNVRWLIPYGPEFLHKEVGRNSYLNPGVLYNDVALEKAVPTSLLHLERGQFIFRAEAQDIANHNNVGLLDVNLLDVGTPSFRNVPQARESNNRALRFWAKFSF